MYKKFGVLMVSAIIIAIAIFGCQQQSQEQAGSETMSMEADVEALKEENRKYDDAYNSGNLDGFVALFTDDAVQLPDEEAIVVGKEAIRLRAKDGFANFTFKLTDTVEDIKVSGNWAFVRGSYVNIITPKEGGDDATEEGKWVAIYQRQADGSWQIYSEIWNNNAPSE
ncbi:MAG: SgcJ/EcaC family oxidoreductase [Ignavibacterium sp.]|nr:MAG: SgcJ/EcaC family oxidoreductase [Ignavibacterium sp.]